MLNLPPDLFLSACDDFVVEQFETRMANADTGLKRTVIEGEWEAYRRRCGTDPTVAEPLFDLSDPHAMTWPLTRDLKVAFDVIPDVLTWLAYGEGDPDWVVIRDPSMNSDALLEQMRRAMS